MLARKTSAEDLYSVSELVARLTPFLKSPLPDVLRQPMTFRLFQECEICVVDLYFSSLMPVWL
jgi:hypothetical protein